MTIRRIQIRKTHTRGFTLIELMVSVSIFVVVLLLTVGAVISILDSNRKAQSISSVMDNLNGALENMTRTIKTNTGYSVEPDGSGVSVRKDDGTNARYSFVEVDGLGSIEYSDQFGNANTVTLTAPEVDVDSFKVVRLLPDGQCNQPKLLLSVVGTAGYDVKTKSVFAVQTVVSQRDFSLPVECF